MPLGSSYPWGPIDSVGPQLLLPSQARYLVIFILYNIVQFVYPIGNHTNSALPYSNSRMNVIDNLNPMST